MPVMKRVKTGYPGVYYVVGEAIATNKRERIFYIRYRKDGRPIEEKAGRQFQNAMTSARAARIRAERIEGRSLSNKASREKRTSEKLNQEWTVKGLWREYIETKPKTPNSIIDDQRFKNHIEPAFGDKRLEDLAPLDLDRLRIKLLKEKSAQTVKNVMELLRRVSNFAKNKRLCRGIDFKIIMPKVSNQKTEFLTEEQLRRLLEAIKNDTNPYAGSLMLIALYTGMRKGEILRLEWRDIDFEHGFIHIRGPKGGQDQRIPLNDPAREVFEKLPRTNELLFPGVPGPRTGIYHSLGKIKRSAGLPADFRPLHGLRHHFASALASSGRADMYVIQKLLTYKSPVMTQRYAHLRDEALKRASDLAGELVSEVLEQPRKELNESRRTGTLRNLG
jgi:integrase